MMYILFGLLLSPSSFVHAVEVCTPENDYLEAALPAQDPAVTPSDFPSICIENAQLSLPLTGFFGYCPAPTGKPARTHRRACVSERYVGSVHGNLVDVTDCLGYDTQLAFATLLLESGAHINAVGAATDVGIGQLTKAAIDEVNLNAFDRALRQVRGSTKPSCQRILPFMTKGVSAIEERCAFMSLPENPARNLIYSILLLQQNRRVVNNLWTRLNIGLPPAVDAERLKVLLAMLAYNAGPAGPVTVLKAYVTQMGAALTDQHFDFEGPDEGGFARYLNDNFPSNDPAARKRISKYVGHVMASARRIDRVSGGMQQCVHLKYLVPPVRVTDQIPAPNRARAAGLIKRFSLDVASQIRDCHEFEFAFLGRALDARGLSPGLRAVHRALCR